MWNSNLSSESSESSSSTGSSASKLVAGTWSRRDLFDSVRLPLSLVLSLAAWRSRSSKSRLKSFSRNSPTLSCPVCLEILTHLLNHIHCQQQ